MIIITLVTCGGEGKEGISPFPPEYLTAAGKKEILDHKEHMHNNMNIPGPISLINIH